MFSAKKSIRSLFLLNYKHISAIVNTNLDKKFICLDNLTVFAGETADQDIITF